MSNRMLSDSGLLKRRQNPKPPARIVTSHLFEAYLLCPTKCFLLAAGEPKADNAYSAWAMERNRSYRVAGIKKLAARFHPSEIMSDAPLDISWASRKSGLAINTPTRAHKLETVIHAVEWIADKQNSNSGTSLIPVRFVADNKLPRSDKLLLAFDAHVLANFLNRPVVVGHIVHGDDFKTHKVKTSEVEREVKKTVGKISALLSGSDPPKLALNRHCAECAYQERCRKLACEKDDLSLLVGLSDKERAKLNCKGIFSVAQLSYTFRPRRRSRRQAGQPEKYHCSLKALAIREKRIHIVGTPQLKIEGTPVYLDIEGLPDCDFYYLVGLRWETTNGVEQRSLWANAPEDEVRLWNDFLSALSGIASPTIIHYGSFETTFLRRMSSRYGAPLEGSVAASAISSAVNLLSVVFAQIYFPTYSNGLKDIARCLGFKWNDPGASGLQSIVWRHEWECLRDLALKEKLIRYNVDDCEALEVVSQTITGLCRNASGSGSAAHDTGIVYTDSLGKAFDSKWKKFKSSIAGLEQINDAAQWDYQRSRVYARPEPIKRPGTTNHKNISKLKQKKHTEIAWTPQNDCPVCASKKRIKDRVIPRYVRDLIFGTTSLKQRFVKHVFQTYRCRTCGHVYGLDERYRAKNYKYGWNLLSYFIYHTVGLCMPQLTAHRSVQRLFGFTCPRSLMNQLKARASNYYAPTKKAILERIVSGHLVHADETRASQRYLKF